MAEPAPTRRRWFQFSIASLLWLTLVVALSVWGFIESSQRRILKAETGLLKAQVSALETRAESLQRKVKQLVNLEYLNGQLKEQIAQQQSSLKRSQNALTKERLERALLDYPRFGDPDVPSMREQRKGDEPFEHREMSLPEEKDQ